MNPKVKFADTSLGTGAREFPATTWGLVTRFREPLGAGFRDGLEDLCRRYWRPVYHYFRVARGRSNEEAKDLAQGFFLWLLEGDALIRYAPERGGFRRYLKVLLRSFLNMHEDEAHARKRGGGARILAFDGEMLSEDEVSVDSAHSDPEKIFDDAWARTVTQRAIHSVRDRFVAAGRQTQFRIFEMHDLAPPGDPPSYGEIAGRLGIKPDKVRDSLAAVRREIRTEIRVELATLTAGDPELEEEWHALFGS